MANRFAIRQMHVAGMPAVEKLFAQRVRRAGRGGLSGAPSDPGAPSDGKASTPAA